MKVQCQVSLGELVDKITILMIKKIKVGEQEKLVLINNELTALLETLQSLNLKAIDSHIESLKLVNLELWDIEDRIREKERAKKFDEEFIELARNVYITNDKRFAFKNKINDVYGSSLKEVKSYRPY